jgi:uncharacterized protein
MKIMLNWKRLIPRWSTSRLNKFLPFGIALICLFGITTFGQQQQIDCASPKSNVESQICTHPDLLHLSGQVADTTAHLESKLKGEDATILKDTEQPFRVLTNNCQNPISSAPDYYERVRACIQNTLDQRLNLLDRAESSPDQIQEAINQAEFISLPFLRKYREQLVGRRLQIVGRMSVAPETHPGEPRLMGTLSDDGESIPVFFKSMDPSNAKWMDTHTPFSWWDVTVQMRGDALVLYCWHLNVTTHR